MAQTRSFGEGKLSGAIVSCRFVRSDAVRRPVVERALLVGLNAAWVPSYP